MPKHLSGIVRHHRDSQGTRFAERIDDFLFAAVAARMSLEGHLDHRADGLPIMRLFEPNQQDFPLR